MMSLEHELIGNIVSYDCWLPSYNSGCKEPYYALIILLAWQMCQASLGITFMI